MKGHENEIIPVFRFCFRRKVSGILEGKIKVANLFCNCVQSTREKTISQGYCIFPHCCFCFVVFVISSYPISFIQFQVEVPFGE